jgi:SagB-type dehydrogenase family enzyme
MQTADRFRRSPGLVIYWAGSQAVCFIWQSSARIPISLEAVDILHAIPDWTTVSELRERIAADGDDAIIQETVDLLLEIGLVERDGDARVETPWLEWPQAAFFHFSTKNGVFPEDLGQKDRDLAAKARHHPPPAPTKRIEGPRLRLPALSEVEGPNASLPGGDLSATLGQRRTWRRFSSRPVPAAALGAVLDATFGVQRRATVPGQGPIILRTSPSGGSRHSIEAYVLAWNVDGLAAGAYHYDSDTRELVDLQRPLSATDIPVLFAHQKYFARAAAIVVMCPVFARSMWRYPQSRAYRTVLIDAGHLGQTFALVATALGLAPFTTMAFSESALEQLLGLDGISECPIYAAGVGMPDPAAGDLPGHWDVGV